MQGGCWGCSRCREALGGGTCASALSYTVPPHAELGAPDNRYCLRFNLGRLLGPSVPAPHTRDLSMHPCKPAGSPMCALPAAAEIVEAQEQGPHQGVQLPQGQVVDGRVWPCWLVCRMAWETGAGEQMQCTVWTEWVGWQSAGACSPIPTIYASGARCMGGCTGSSAAEGGGAMRMQRGLCAFGAVLVWVWCTGNGS